MPFDQLRALVVSLIGPVPEPAPGPEPDTEDEPDVARCGAAHSGVRDRLPTIEDDPVREFETQTTHYLGPRTSTLDQLIAFLRKH